MNLKKTICFTTVICMLVVTTIVYVCKDDKNEQSVETPKIEYEVPETELVVVEPIESMVVSEAIEESIEVVEEESGSVFYLSDYQRWVTECVVMGESGDEPYEGQRWVAFCILNGCIKEGVQPSELRTLYKYSGWNENPTQEVKDAVASVFDDRYRPTEDNPLWFYAPKWSTSEWHESQRYVDTIGGHRFFTEWTD